MTRNTLAFSPARAVLLLVAAASLGSRPAVADADNDATLKAIAEGYLDHRASFDFFTCRFQVTAGKARTVEAALQGEPLADPFVAQGLWIVRGRYVKFEIISDVAAVERIFAARTEQTVAVPLPSNKFLDDGVNQLYYSPIGSHGHVFTDRRAGISLTPFDMGVMGHNEVGNPGDSILKAFRFDRPPRWKGTETIDGHETLVVEIFANGEPTDRWKRTFWLDPERGFLPIQVTMIGVSSLTRITHVQECPGGRWFPQRSINISNPDQEKGPFHVREIKVVELDVSKPPADEQFFVDLPKGARFNDAITPGSQFRLAADRRADLAEMNTLLSEMDGAAQHRPALERPQESGNAARWVAALVAGTLAVICCSLAVRRWRKNHRLPRAE